MKRRTLILLLGSPLALAAVVAGAVLMVPADRVAALAAGRAEAALGRDVRIAGAGIELLPAPGIALEGVAIAGADTAAPPLATARRIVLRPKLLPLLARRVVIDEIMLDRPRLLVSIDSTGASNLPTARRAAAQDDAGGPGDDSGGLAFLVDRLRITGGRFAFRDDRTNTAVRLDGVEQRLRLSGELRGGTLARIRLDGELGIEALGALLPGRLAVPIRGLRLHLAHDALLDRSADSLALDRLALRVQDVALDGTGAVRGLGSPDSRRLSLRLAAGPVDIGDLLGSLPAELVERLAPAGAERPDADGSVSIRVSADGPLGADSLPDLHGTIDLDDLRLAWGDARDVLTGLGGRIAFTRDSLAADGLEGELLGRPLRLAFAVRDPAAPVASVRLRTTVDLERATAIGLLPDTLEARGDVDVDVRAAAPLLRPATGTVDGAVSLAGISARPAALQVPLRVEDGRIALDGRRLRGEALRLRLGESDIELDLDIDGWLPLALGDSAAAPTATLDARSRLLDADAVLGVKDSIGYGELLFARLADRPVRGRPAGVVAEEAGFGLPTLPPIALLGRYRADVLRRNGLELHDVDVAFTGDGDRLELTDARFDLMGGGVQVTGRLGLSASEPAGSAATADGPAGFPTVISYQLRDVGAAAFFDRFTPFRGHLSGSLLLAGTARMVLDENLLPVRESVAAEGSIAVSDGRLVDWPLVRALGERLGLAGFDTLTVRDWAGEFHVAGPEVTLRESLLESDELTVRAAGAFDVAGRLDLAATLLLSPSLAGRVRGTVAPRLTAAAAGADGSVPIGLRITGAARDPELSLDFSEAADNAVAQARRAAEERARELAGQAAGRAVDALLPADSLAAPADSTRVRLEAELKSRLRKLIRIKH